jgi:hypothetical protein
MKRFKWKVAIVTFLTFLAIDGLLLALDIRFPDNSVIISISRVVQFPGLPVLLMFPVPFSAGDDYTWDHDDQRHQYIQRHCVGCARGVSRAPLQCGLRTIV